MSTTTTTTDTPTQPTPAKPTSSTRSTTTAYVPGSQPTYSLERLASMSIGELTAVYKTGTVPDSLTALDGKPKSRMLTTVGPIGRGLVHKAIQRYAGSDRFLWAGKSFSAQSDDEGRGINRVRLLGNRDWFPFETSVVPSAIDGQRCIVLDYDLAENPWFIRKIHDELREVSPGLFLGPAMWKTDTDPALLLYFACDTSRG